MKKELTPNDKKWRSYRRNKNKEMKPKQRGEFERKTERKMEEILRSLLFSSGILTSSQQIVTCEYYCLLLC